MELQLGNIVSKLLVLLLAPLFGDVGKFISRAKFLLQNFLMIFSDSCDDDDGDDDDDDEQVQLLQKMPCKKAQSSYNSSVVEVEERRMSVAEMNLVMNRLGMEGINENSSVGGGGGGAEGVFEEEEPSLDEIKETFRVFDANNDGFIDGSDLHRIISNLGFKEMYDLEDYKRMIKAFDGDGDGLIDFPDFIKLMEKCLC